MSVQKYHKFSKCGSFVRDNGKALFPMHGYLPIPNFSFYFIFNVRRYSFCSGVIL